MKISSKQRAYLRGLANSLPALFQVGKGGVNEQLVETINQALEAREIIKIHVLENALVDAKTICEELVEETGAAPVQVIGRKIVLYRPSEEKPQIVLP